MSAIGIAFALLAMISLSTTVILLRVATDAGRSSDALVIVLLSNVTILIPLAIIFGNPVAELNTVAVISFALAGFVGTLIGRAFYYASIERVGASRSEPIKASQPIYATIVAVLVLGEVLVAPHFLGIALIVVGVGAISWETASNMNHGPEQRSDLLLPVAASFFYGIEPVFAKIGFGTGTSVLVGLSIKTVAATVGFLAYLRWRHAFPHPSTIVDRSLRLYLVAGALNTLFLLSYYAALEIAPVVLVVPIVQMSPLTVALLSFVFLKRLEKVTIPLILWAVVVVAGGILVSIYG